MLILHSFSVNRSNWAKAIPIDTQVMDVLSQAKKVRSLARQGMFIRESLW